MARLNPGSGQGWDRGAETLVTLGKQTGNHGDELIAIIKQLVVAAEPLSGKFEGPGREAFNRLKELAHGHSRSAMLGLSRVNEGQLGMEKAFAGGDHEMADEAHRNLAAVSGFDAQKFHSP